MAWRFGGKLGSGGFGNVYEASRDGDATEYAVKFLDDQACENAEAVARFKREVKLQRGLDHPHIVSIVDADVDATSPFFVMPRADRSLQEILEGEGLTESECDRIFRCVLEAMVYAHANRTIHRDMKPLNILLYGNVPMISDFGLGKNLASDSATITKTTSLVGTFIYMAPEQLADPRSADERSDVYALGKTLQQMVTGQLPLPGLSSKIPRKYRYLIERCCEQEERDRYQTVESLLTAFDQVVAGIEKPEVASEEAERLVTAWQAEILNDLPILRDLHALFERHVDDAEFFQDHFPRLPDPLLREYMIQLPRDFERMLRVYDEHVSGSLDFNYCDVVADFYLKVWRQLDGIGIRRLLFTRLVEMGAWHNRFHVGDVVESLVSTIDDQSEAMMVADVFAAHPQEAGFFEPYLTRDRLPRVIASALDEREHEIASSQPPSSDDIPF
jgi:eukaryotic-like serine/threonine-protein kinase